MFECGHEDQLTELREWVEELERALRAWLQWDAFSARIGPPTQWSEETDGIWLRLYQTALDESRAALGDAAVDELYTAKPDA